MGKYSKEDIIRLVEENDIKFIRLQFSDIFGSLKNVSITDRQLNRILENGCMFDGSSIEGFVRIEESDMILKPQLDSFNIFPWRPQQGKVARLICDVYRPDNIPFEGDPRNVLKKVIDEAKSLGYTMNVGPECEFFLFHTDDKGQPTTIAQDNGGYFDLAPTDMGENARRDMTLVLEQMGFEIETSHHEVAPGQNEIDFKYADALTTADNIMTFKLIVKTIAQRHGLYATFMPKPTFAVSGSGMHINISLFNDGKNAFVDEKDKNGLSKIAYNFIGGIMENILGMIAITNPLVNSYKRLVSGYEAPVYIAWSNKNRSPLIRVPASKNYEKRIEVRCPDPSANPYLVLACLLKAGLKGIKENIEAPKSIEKNIFDMSAKDREQENIKCLPKDLREAISEMKKSSLVRDVLGEHIFNKYIEAKTLEWNEYVKQVHQWEIDKYLKKY